MDVTIADIIIQVLAPVHVLVRAVKRKANFDARSTDRHPLHPRITPHHSLHLHITSIRNLIDGQNPHNQRKDAIRKKYAVFGATTADIITESEQMK